jgi:hypothetical protein
VVTRVLAAASKINTSLSGSGNISLSSQIQLTLTLRDSNTTLP